MQTLLCRCVAVAALLAVTGTARATDFTDYRWTSTPCVSVSPTELVLQICGPLGCDSPTASFVAPVPGTFTLDMHYEVVGAPSDVAVWVGSFNFSSWCGPNPCSGDVAGIVVPVEAGDMFGIAVQWGWDPYCYPGRGTTCTFTNFQFHPEVGVTSLGGAVSGSHLFTYAPDETSFIVGGLVELADVNGDGHDDWALGDSSGSIAGTWGVARIMSGTDGSVLHELKDPSFAEFGSALADVGDLDGDGADDLAITEASWPGPGGSGGIGRVHVVSGATGATLFMLQGKQPLSKWGSSIDGVGDIDGDGLGDILVGAYKEEGAAFEQDAGAVRVYSGATQAILFEAYGSTHDYMGYDVAGVGDVNADGTPDFAACAPEYATEDPTGVARVWSGAGGVIYSFWGVKHEVPSVVAGAGDVDADGHPDVIVGAPSAKTPSLPHYGTATVRSGATGVTLFKLSGTLKYQALGEFASRAGDLEGDGFGDVLIGEPGVDYDSGAVHALAGPSGAPLFDITPEQDMSFYSLVAGGHDLDADGTPDVVLLTSNQVHGYSGVPAVNVPPTLDIEGSLLAGSPLTLSLANGPSGGTATLVIGLELVSLPYKSGVLGPSLDRLVPGLPLLPDGSLQLQSKWPAGLVAPVTVFVQAWMPSAAATQGVVGTSTLMLSPP